MTHTGQSGNAEGVAVAAAPATAWITRTLGVFAVVLALLSAFTTFVVLAGLTPIAPTHQVVVTLLLVNAVTVALLVGLIGREMWRVLQARRRGRAAARLHVRIVALFSLIAAVPAILVAVVASVTLDRGLDRLFSRQTHSLIENSLIVADAYVRDHVQFARGDAIAIAIELARAKPMFDQTRDQFRQFLSVQASIRGLPVLMLIDKDLKPIEQVEPKVKQDFSTPSREVLASVNDTEPQVAMFLDANYIAAIIKLRGYDDLYLYTARLLDPRVLAQLRATQEGVAQYADLEARRIGVQVAFGLMYTVIALIVLLSAVWIGLNFANYLVAPIRRLIGAAQVVATGNLYVQVPTRRSEGDLAQLGETFNKMTQELRTQRDDIVRARDLIDSRRRFTEAVLAGASAGVIGVDSDSRITILNRSAERLIGRSESEALSRPLTDIVPELAEIFTSARTGAQRLVQGQMTISRANKERNLSVRVTSEQSGAAERGYVVTLDDITDLVAAQRTSAWADVARRIAHEIKNPLTPIQLSAERLRRRYAGVVQEGDTIFKQCTDTIVRQVDDIKRMVDEFSRFARMPKPVMEPDNVADTVRQVVFLQRVGNADIDIDVEIAEDPMPARFDRRLISQGLTNIIKNATEAIAAVPAAELGRGKIHVSAERDGSDIVIDIVDNGIGLPKENRSRLLEPYVTTREKGTGLGLAIVGRILEDHGGRIELGDASEKIPGQRGAWMRLRFSAAPAGSAEAEPARETITAKLATGE
jgi:two-component system, NtrC family, nitrogen regulation sensor histidine kinase NtrY